MMIFRFAFMYVLEGALRAQVEGQATATLKPGEIFHESPNDIHTVSANATATEPLKFLVFFVKDQGRPSSRAVTIKEKS